MNKRELNKLKYLLSHTYIDIEVPFGKIKPLDFFNKHPHYGNHVEILKIVKDNNINNDELFELINIAEQEYEDFRKLMSTNNCRINRDNKIDYNYGGGSQGNVIRYPRKNRSLKTWRNFYKLFPKRAELDGFNGKTSKRMK